MVIVLVAALAQAVGATTNRADDLDARARIAAREFRAAKKANPDLLLPKLPAGFQLRFVGGNGSDLTWHRVSDDAVVHLWQSSDPLLPADKDPTDPSTGTLVTIDGKTWVRNTINACADTTCLSRRFHNGKTAVSLNGSLPVNRMERIAASLSRLLVQRPPLH
jgi:hypothetical protein